MNDTELTPEERIAFRTDAEGLAYGPDEVESIYSSLVRDHLRLNEYARRAQQDQESRLAESRLIDPSQPYRRGTYPWVHCDPEMRISKTVAKYTMEWVKRFDRLLTPEPGVIDPGAYATLRDIHSRLRGDGEVGTPGDGVPISRETFGYLSDSEDHESYEAAYFVLKDGIQIEDAILAAFTGRYGRFSHDDPEAVLNSNSFQGTVWYVRSEIHIDAWTRDDLPLLSAYWRGQLEARLLRFARYHALDLSLFDIAHNDPFFDQAYQSPGSVTAHQARHALATLEALRRLPSPIATYREVEREIELDHQSSSGITGQGVRVGATRALRALGKQPRPQTLHDLLAAAEDTLRKIAFESDGDGLSETATRQR